MPYLFHNNPHPVNYLDCEGRTHIIPPNRPWSVPSLDGTDIPGLEGQPAYRTFTIPADKLAKAIMEDRKHDGLVLVAEQISDSGIAFDVKTAAQASSEARYRDQTAILDQYVKSAHEDELNKQPVRPPAESIQKILDDRGLDLQKDFGVTPVGYKVSEYAQARDEKMKTMEAENTSLRKEVSDIKKMMERAMETMLLADTSKKAPK